MSQKPSQEQQSEKQEKKISPPPVPLHNTNSFLLRRAVYLIFLVGAIAVAYYNTSTDSNNGSSSAHKGFGVLWMAPFWSGGGYCTEAQTYALALKPHLKQFRIGHHGDLINYAYVTGLAPDVRGNLTILAQTPLSMPNTIVICHSEPGAWDPAQFQTTVCPPAGVAYKIGRTMFETDRIPSGWDKRCNKMDQIWVPGPFHMKTFIAGGVKPEKLRIVPEAVDVDFFDPKRASLMSLPLYQETVKKSFKFLSVFKWENRKGWDVLLDAYFQEFTIEDDVVLYLLTKPPEIDPNKPQPTIPELVEPFVRKRKYDKSRLPAWVDIRDIPSTEMPDLYASVHALVIPSRGEGWGRPHCEAMAMGLPVIATNWSGNTDFMTEENSYLIPIDGLTDIRMGPFKGHKWASPSIPKLREIMRYVSSHLPEAREKGKKARADMVQKYAPQVVAKILLERLKDVNLELDTRRVEKEKAEQEQKKKEL